MFPFIRLADKNNIFWSHSNEWSNEGSNYTEGYELIILENTIDAFQYVKTLSQSTFLLWKKQST